MRGNLAIVGCGAIAQQFYLPALGRRRAEFNKVWLVDPSDRALAATASMVMGEKAHNLSDIGDELQFVVIAAPNALHFPLAMEALSRNAHLLVEKPFVIWPEEGRKLIAAAAERKRVVAINQTRRLYPNLRGLRRRIANGDFGALKSVVHHEGVRLVWPFESGAAFSKGAERTGVIMDLGVHVLDVYQYILKPTWNFISAIHDGFRGPEGLAEIQLKASGAPVSIRLSRYVRQENIAHLSFERGEVLIDRNETDFYLVKDKSASVSRIETRSELGDDIAENLLMNFLAAGEGRETAVCEAASSLPVIELLDEIYRRAQRYPAQLGAV
jgi:predicted dehydrogenase